ncbi:DNA mismatch repair endonuclease MutL [uncultured Ezakiella sp.]|uniref:DNA mismatch repair endonuclease MutL n=1 Tax=uncultured Ezakiella sp. TaxID=1637529 RepID=UPI0025CCD1DE|nr:DNA mismatch repair endonuclease MutL [uncultured Ezakiella sp.]
MNKIRELSQDTIEKIAAGEVIERPESVIKEAVENSIDAESTSILIDIKSGGKDYIRVTDNGIGISYDDLDSAFKKHCTSKIVSFDEIYNLNSCGFRGEALNSIASVSKASLISKIEGEDAYRIDYEYGNFLKKVNAVANQGTSLIVEDLFGNMPVRKRLLASDRTEENRIRSLIERFAIGYPKIAFKLVSNSRVLINTSGSNDLKQAIFEVFGKNVVKDIIEIKSSRMKGYISNSNLYSNNTSNQMIFINNRIVYNEELAKAVETQYFSKIPNTKHPIFFLFIDVDKNEVDVNIHPSKKYVKITFNEELVGDIKTTISNSLEESNKFSFYNNNDDDSIEFRIYEKDDCDNDSVRDEEISLEIPMDKNIVLSPVLEMDENSSIPYIQNELNISVPNIIVHEKDINYEPDKLIDLNNIFPDKKVGSFNKLVGVIIKKYLLIENRPNGLLILMDLHQALARNFFDLYIKDINAKTVPIQGFLEPIVYKFDYNDAEFISNNLDLMLELGFDLTAMAKDSFLLRGIPSYLTDYFKEEDLIDIVKNVSKDKKLVLPNLINRVSLIAANADPFFNDMTAKNILDKLLESNEPYTSPSGQAIFKILPAEEFVRRFYYE